jgi:hypothetical protein
VQQTKQEGQETIKQQGYNKKFKVSAHDNVFITSGNNALRIITQLDVTIIFFKTGND